MSERYEGERPLCTLYIVKYSLYSILEPVQFTQMGSDVFVIWNVADEPCGGVLDSLKWLECRLGKTRQHRVAVVHGDRHHQTDGDVFSDTATHLT